MSGKGPHGHTQANGPRKHMPTPQPLRSYKEEERQTDRQGHPLTHFSHCPSTPGTWPLTLAPCAALSSLPLVSRKLVSFPACLGLGAGLRAAKAMLMVLLEKTEASQDHLGS